MWSTMRTGESVKIINKGKDYILVNSKKIKFLTCIYPDLKSNTAICPR